MSWPYHNLGGNGRAATSRDNIVRTGNWARAAERQEVKDCGIRLAIHGIRATIGILLFSINMMLEENPRWLSYKRFR